MATPLAWQPDRPRLRPLRLVAAWLASALGLLLAAAIVPGAHVHDFGGAVVVAAIVAVLNAILPPVIAALRLPFTVALGFVLVLALDAAMLLLAADIAPDDLYVDDFWTALAVSVLAAAFSMAISVVMGIDDHDGYTLRVARRVARRTGKPISGDVPGILFLEIDGLGLPVLRRAIRDGTTPNMARWLAEESHRLLEWETDLSSQTGASQAGILLGDNDDIPAFRWVDKATGRLTTCSNPDDCAAIERERSGSAGLLAGGGTSRGNLLSGGADAAILTVSRLSAEKSANPGYRAFLANGANVTRTLALFLWELLLELVAAAQQRRRDVHPRGHRGGSYPFVRAGMCVFVRDLIVFSVLQDMFRGVPAVYATFSSYDEVAH
ncbi:MAG: phage holin family protein, partial [Thermoleophilaceae bacterium]